jgi:hypothetical protein
MPADQKPVLLALDLVRTDGGTQARTCLGDATVAEYAEVLLQVGTGAAPGQLTPDVTLEQVTEVLHSARWIGQYMHEQRIDALTTLGHILNRSAP